MDGDRTQNSVRHDWQVHEVLGIYQRPLLDLVFAAAQVHRQFHDPHAVQKATLLSIKTGACPEDCAYCPQSARHAADVDKQALLDVDSVVACAREAKSAGASRFCMGAAWRSVKAGEQFDRVLEMVRQVDALGLESCVTLGMLEQNQADALKLAGLKAYNHNLDTSAEYYGEIITTRTYADRLQTIARVQKAGIEVCAGGIVGMGESQRDRASMLQALATLDPHPQSVPINLLVRVPGTPLENAPDLPPFELVRTVATARIVMPKSRVRLSAGRTSLSQETQALCFLAGANSIFFGGKLLTTPNPTEQADEQLLAQLGLYAN